jgi:SpoU rRNA methylase family enzyme
MRSRTLNEIVEACGHQAAIALTRSFGGRQLSVPSAERLTETHAIALCIGLTAARKLAKAKGGERLEIPSEVNAVLELRNEAVVAAFDEGASIRSISFDQGLSRKWVRHILVRSGREAELDRREALRNGSHLPDDGADE